MDPGRRCWLEQIVAGALLIIPGTAAAAVETLDRRGRLQAPVMVGDDITRAVMTAQNNTGQGPCLDALRDGKQVVVNDLRVDLRWPKLAAHALKVGIRSMICTPLVADGRTLGELSLMSRTPRYHHPDDSPAMATVFAAHAAHAAIALTGARRVEDIVAALGHRDVIGQAKGILMERYKITPMCHRPTGRSPRSPHLSSPAGFSFTAPRTGLTTARPAAPTISRNGHRCRVPATHHRFSLLLASSRR